MVVHRLLRVPEFDSHEAVLVCTHLLWLFNVWDRSASLGREVGSLPRWSPVLGGGLVLRFRQAVVESKFPLRGVDGVGLLLQGWKGGCGFRGWQVDESSSRFPRRRMSTMASSDSWSGGLGVRPRPMIVQHVLHPVPGVGCPLRLFSKPWCDGASSDLG